MGNRAGTYAAQNQRDEAERLWRDVLQSDRHVLGDTHPDTLGTMAVLGQFLTRSPDKLDEAESLLLEALRGCRQALDRNHMATNLALAGLSVLYLRKKDFKKVGAYLCEAVDITRAQLGSDHGLTAQANHNAGVFLAFQQDHGKAKRYLREYLAWYMRTKADDYGRFYAEMWLAASLLGQKKHAEAEPLLISAYKGITAREKIAPGEHEADLRKAVEQILLLCTEAGRLANKTALDEIRADPRFQELELDLRFPANAFAPQDPARPIQTRGLPDRPGTAAR